MTDADIRLRLLLSTQQALLDAVPAALRSVTCAWEGIMILSQFRFDGEISEDGEESVRMAETQVIADVPSPWTPGENIVRYDHPADRRGCALPLWAYARKERTSEGVPLR